jgi:hypothetical protein
VTDTLSGEPVVRFAPSDAQVIRHWVLQTRVSGAWRSRILPGVERNRILKDGDAAADLISVAAVDRAGNISAPALVERR